MKIPRKRDIIQILCHKFICLASGQSDPKTFRVQSCKHFGMITRAHFAGVSA